MDIAFKLECLRLADGNVLQAQEMAEWLAGSRPAAAASSSPVCFLSLTAEEKTWLTNMLREVSADGFRPWGRRVAAGILLQIETL